MVLVHGLSDSCRTWNRLAPALAAAGRRVVALDLPGHGDSARPDAPYTVAWYAGVVAEWSRALRLGDFDLVGHSFGGSIAMCVATVRYAEPFFVPVLFGVALAAISSPIASWVTRRRLPPAGRGGA
ncbi:alpha/beta fold hydrolase [Sorangium sp. So ce281]|uniref:alpha/beta fold hydrolase n=1 Tax=unclassified Sorangium TaxID=2621164 RepID=UPI003F5F789B